MTKENKTKEKKVAAGRPKSTEKQQQILASASSLFLQQGFTATSMDTVAKHAGVSKQTVYSHYKNKDALFTAVIAIKCHEYRLDEQQLLHPEKNVEEVLSLLGEQFVRLLHDDDVIAMYRVVIGEVSTNNQVTTLFFNAGPKQAMEMLMQYLQCQTDIPLPQHKIQYLAMVFFNMLKGEHHMKSLMGLPGRLAIAEQTDFVSQVVADYLLILRAAGVGKTD